MKTRHWHTKGKSVRSLMVLLLAVGLLMGGCISPVSQPPAVTSTPLATAPLLPTDTPNLPLAEPTLSPIVEDPPLPTAPLNPTEESTSTPAIEDPPLPTAATETIKEQAPINSVVVTVSESKPVQVNILVKGYLKDSCTTISDVDMTEQGNEFIIYITTVRPADVACMQVIENFERTIPLAVRGLKAGTYTVTVNGVSETFTLQTDVAP